MGVTLWNLLLLIIIQRNQMNTYDVESCTTYVPRDCQDLQCLGHTDSGVYHVIPVGTLDGYDVYCDMVTDAGGWLVRAMPRKKNCRRSAAQKQVMERRLSVKSGKGWDEGVSNSLGPSGLVPLAGTTAKASHHLVCLAKDEGLTTPTDPSGSVPLVDLSSMPSALQGCKYTDGGKARPTCLSHIDTDRLVHGCPRRMVVSSVPNDTSLETSQETINETSQELTIETINETVNETSLETVSEKSHETTSEMSCETTSEISHEACSETQKNCSNMQKNCQNLSETIMENCYNTDCENTEAKMSYTANEILETADTDNAQRSDTSNFLNRSCHYAVTSLRNEEDVRSSLQFEAGPPHSIKFLRGSFSQADCMFSQESRGSQCSVNALCALIFAKFSHLQTKQNLDQVLLHGDRLYNELLSDLKAKGMFRSKLLTFEELPNKVNLFDREISIDKYDIISGVCTQQLASLGLPSLHQALHTAFQTSSHILFMIGSICSAIFKMNNEYYFFDSHSHGSDGMACPDGQSELVSFQSLDDLVAFMYAVYDSMFIDISAQFDMLPISLRISSAGHIQHIHGAIGNKAGPYNFKTYSMKTVTNYSKKKASCDNNYRTELKKTSKPLSNDESNSTLIGRYFEDQRLKHDCKQKGKKCQTNRKIYQRIYKQKQRQSVPYKEKEKVAKRISRKDDEIKIKERQRTLQSMRRARESTDFKERERVAKRSCRQGDEITVMERQRTLKAMRYARESTDFKERERVAKRSSRQDDEIKIKERQKTLKSMKYARESTDFREKEKNAKRSSRLDDKIKIKEREKTLKSMRHARESTDFKEKEKVAKNRLRQNDDMKFQERQSTLKSKRRARKSSNFKEKERLAKRMARDCLKFKEKELVGQRNSKKKARSDLLVLETERIRKQIWRSDERNKLSENILACKKKALKRKDTLFHEEETKAAKSRKYGSDINTCIELFHKRIAVGPVYICSSCHQTWFKESVSRVSANSNWYDSHYLSGKLSVDNTEWICITCKNSLINHRVPKLSVKNGFKWPDKPKELELHPLEERLIALRIPFMQMRELPRGRQYSIKGNIVNVPVEIQPVVDALPRPFDENVTVPVKLKKKLSHKSCAFTENVRPLRVLVALHWLMNHSKLYQNSGAHIDENWVKQVTQDSVETVKEFMEPLKSEHTSNDASNACIRHLPKEVQKDNICDDLCDSDAEDITQKNVGNIDTLLDDGNLENRNCTLTFAPGENQRPLSIYQDTDSEYLCFPTIFCGQRRPENNERSTPVHYSDIAKWELRSSDRRAANSVPNIFFKLKKIQMKQLNDKVSLAVRRCQVGGKTITVAQARDSNYTEDIVKKDQGYFIFKQLRNSPSYLETRKKDVFAMIRQLGLPTWFMSLSSADTRWSDLLKMLAKLNNSSDYSDDEINELTWEQKTKLIQKDPVTCSRYFDHRVQQFINLVLRSVHNPLGIITDYFYRVEFQQRGSPHIHLIAWVENSPKYQVNSIDDITDYVDKYLKCSSTNDKLSDLIQLQVHNHSRTCRKKVDKLCRFGYPLPPLPKTMVLEPLDSDIDKYKKKYAKIQKQMNEQKDGYDMTYNQFLKEVAGLSEEEYIKCIRSTLTTTKVFLERQPKDIRLNLYNETVLQAWKANIDIQFILDPYACAMYIVSYISKSQREMSSLMHAAAKEARNGNFDIKRQVRHIGNAFSNSVEVSAQEAVYLVLQMPLTNSTRQVVFINTSLPDKRIQLIKSKTVLHEMPEDSTDVIAENVITRYSKRPKALENWCLADYISQLDIIYPNDDSAAEKVEDVNDDREIESDSEEFDDNLTVITLKNGIKIRRRQNNKILRYVRFSKKTDEENHFREKLLLFLPWRNEDTDLISTYKTYKDHYTAVRGWIDWKCKEYENHVEELELAKEMAENDMQDAFDEIAPGTEQIESETAEEQPVDSEKFVCFNPDRVTEQCNYDIGTEIGSSCSVTRIEQSTNLLADDAYDKLLRSLNSKQKYFYNHVIHWIKTKDEPLYAFLSGGAGVGKSVVIRALYQTLYRLLNLKEGENPNDIRVLLCAFTGKAAFNIGGPTISTAFHQKFKQSDQTLSCDMLNTFRSKYRNLSVVIIDEISMVGNALFALIDQRLQELTGSRTPFGNISIIAVGDLYQLQPVRGNWIFNDLTQGASALATNLWKEHFSMFELTEIMRQKDDLEFTELLNRLRHNNLTEADMQKIKSCQISKECANYPKSAPHLFAENKFMHAFNDEIIHALKTEKVTVSCHDVVLSPSMSYTDQKKLLSKLPKDSSHTANLHLSLVIVVDMIYDLTVNVNTEDGLANGASCVIKYIDYRQANSSRPSIIWVQFDDPQIGVQRRKQYRRFYNEHIAESWTPVFDIERTFVYGQVSKNATIQRIQFPLQPAAGRSVHRAQGTTLDKVVIDLTQNKTRKVPHLHYVALSRVRSMQNLYILNFNEDALKVDQQVETEMTRLKNCAVLDLCYIPFDTIDLRSHFKIAYNNCRSLHKHIEDVRHDRSILSAHVVGISESRLCEKDDSDSYLVEGFDMIRNDQQMRTDLIRPSHGSAVYVRNDVTILKSYSYNSKELELTFIYCQHELISIQVVVVYKSPSSPFSALIKNFEKELLPRVDQSKPFVIIGDFNIDIQQKKTRIEQFMFERFGCKQLMDRPTTDNGSVIDLIFSNYHGNIGTEETYWSDHKLLHFFTE